MELILTKYPTNDFSGNPVVFQWCVNPFHSVVAEQNPYIIITVLAETTRGSSVYTEIKKLKTFPDANGLFSADISSICDAYLNYLLPPVDLDQAMIAPKQTWEFRVEARIYFGAQVQFLSGSPDRSIILVKGRTPYEYPVLSQNYESRSELANRPPLQFINETERIFKDDTAFLFYKSNLFPPHSYELKCLLTYLLDDEQDTLESTILSDITSHALSVYCLPAGYQQLGIEDLLPTGAIAISYKLTVTAKYTDATPSWIVAEVSYEIDHRKFYNSRQLLYRNSIGGLQQLRLNGSIDFDNEYNVIPAQQKAPDSWIINGNLIGEQSSPWTEEQPKYSGNTGFMSKFETDRMRDLFLSSEVYEVRDNRLVPVVINKKTVKFYTNNANLYSVDLEWQDAFKNIGWSQQNLPASECPGMLKLEWRQSANDQITVFWQLPFGYDYAQIKIKWEFDDSEEVFTVEGNSGSAKLNFTRPGFATGAEDLSVSGRVICNRYKETPDYGAWTLLAAATINPEFSIVCLDDGASIPKGHSTPQTLINALTNDYDPDGGAIEAVADSGSTHDGGAFTINTAGAVTYTPPSTSYIGTDYFTYQAKKTGGTVLSTATYRIVVY